MSDMFKMDIAMEIHRLLGKKENTFLAWKLSVGRKEALEDLLETVKKLSKNNPTK